MCREWLGCPRLAWAADLLRLSCDERLPPARAARPSVKIGGWGLHNPSSACAALLPCNSWIPRRSQAMMTKGLAYCTPVLLETWPTGHHLLSFRPSSVIDPRITLLESVMPSHCPEQLSVSGTWYLQFGVTCPTDCRLQWGPRQSISYSCGPISSDDIYNLVWHVQQIADCSEALGSLLATLVDLFQVHPPRYLASAGSTSSQLLPGLPARAKTKHLGFHATAPFKVMGAVWRQCLCVYVWLQACTSMRTLRFDIRTHAHTHTRTHSPMRTRMHRHIRRPPLVAPASTPSRPGGAGP